MKLVLRNVRLSFPDLFEAKQYQGQGPFYYRATFLMAPDSAEKKAIDAAIKQVATDKWNAKATAKLPGILANPQKCCFIDGNLKEYNGYAGNWALTAVRSEEHGAPAVVDRLKNPLTAKDGKLYSGCYVNAVVDIRADDNAYGAAIRAALVSVQFVKDGESFGGASPASANDFDELPFEDEDETADSFF